MNSATTTSKPILSSTTARGSMIAGAFSLLVLATLHLLSPEFNPATRMVSEYALGEYGWLLSIFFLSWALSCVTLYFAIKSQVKTGWGKIGLGVLLVSALGMGMASVFDVSHELHGLSALIGMPTLPIAAMLITPSLLRNRGWSSARTVLMWTANLTWLSLVAMVIIVFIGLARNGGEFGPTLMVGWPNRLVIICYCMWVMTTAWHTVNNSIPVYSYLGSEYLRGNILTNFRQSYTHNHVK
jgi:hypothetical protein